MKEAGMPDWITQWVRSYLHNRTFRIKWDAELSKEKELKAGVPQGSVLGPLLFNIYTADFPINRNNWHCMIAIYADDVALLARSKSMELAKKYSQEELTPIVNWYNKWRLAINTKKTQAIAFTMPRSRENAGSCLRIKGQPIPWLDSATYLGVTIDQRLTFSPHVNNTITKMKGIKAILAPIIRSNSTPDTIKIKLYNSIIKPILLYGTPAWAGLTSSTMLKKIEISERKILRQMLRLPPWTNNEEVYKEAGVENIKKVIRQNATKYYEDLINSNKNPAMDLARNNSVYGKERCRRKTMKIPIDVKNI
jgi:hypothetical protein